MFKRKPFYHDLVFTKLLYRVDICNDLFSRFHLVFLGRALSYDIRCLLNGRHNHRARETARRRPAGLAMSASSWAAEAGERAQKSTGSTSKHRIFTATFSSRISHKAVGCPKHSSRAGRTTVKSIGELCYGRVCIRVCVRR